MHIAAETPIACKGHDGIETWLVRQVSRLRVSAIQINLYDVNDNVSSTAYTIGSQPNWMSAPQEVVPGCPPGLEYLTQIDQLLVNQQVELFEGRSSHRWHLAAV
jgi:hypothetical protein